MYYYNHSWSVMRKTLHYFFWNCPANPQIMGPIHLYTKNRRSLPDSKQDQVEILLNIGPLRWHLWIQEIWKNPPETVTTILTFCQPNMGLWLNTYASHTTLNFRLNYPVKRYWSILVSHTNLSRKSSHLSHEMFLQFRQDFLTER